MVLSAYSLRAWVKILQEHLRPVNTSCIFSTWAKKAEAVNISGHLGNVTVIEDPKTAVQTSPFAFGDGQDDSQTFQKEGATHALYYYLFTAGQTYKYLESNLLCSFTSALCLSVLPCLKN